MQNEKIKEIFYSLVTGKAYQERFTEIKRLEGYDKYNDAVTECASRIIAIDKDLGFEIEDKAAELGATSELCGFILGFRYAMEFMAECFGKWEVA